MVTRTIPRELLVSHLLYKCGSDITILTCIEDWAGGETDYSNGPYSMYMKSLTVTDYSTGDSYGYSDKTGDWKSITASGGKVNGNSADEPTSTESAPAITATVDSIPVPWSGTHKETSSWVTPNVWPWVATNAPSSTSTDLPSGWESRSNHIQPPSGGSVSEHTPAPTNSSLDSITKTGFSTSQSTFHSTSVPLASLSAAFSPSGLKSSTKNVTRHASKTTTKDHRTQTAATAKATAEDEPTATTVSSHGAPSVNAGTSRFQPRTIFVALSTIICALFGGTVMLL